MFSGTDGTRRAVAMFGTLVGRLFRLKRTIACVTKSPDPLLSSIPTISGNNGDIDRNHQSPRLSRSIDLIRFFFFILGQQSRRLLLAMILWIAAQIGRQPFFFLADHASKPYLPSIIPMNPREPKSLLCMSSSTTRTNWITDSPLSLLSPYHKKPQTPNSCTALFSPINSYLQTVHNPQSFFSSLGHLNQTGVWWAPLFSTYKAPRVVALLWSCSSPLQCTDGALDLLDFCKTTSAEIWEQPSPLSSPFAVTTTWQWGKALSFFFPNPLPYATSLSGTLRSRILDHQ